MVLVRSVSPYLVYKQRVRTAKPIDLMLQGKKNNMTTFADQEYVWLAMLAVRVLFGVTRRRCASASW